MNDDYRRTADKVSVISIVANVILSVLKLAAGIFAHSAAMISDAIHSASDVFSTFVVMIGIRLASKEADDEHPYGHERLECVTAIILSIILCISGCAIGWAAFKKIISGNYASIEAPGVLALVAACVSIVVKEAMYWYTRHYALKLNSDALMANAWDHRSDAFSSVGALIGIAAARMGYPVADSIASLIIFVFIVKVSIQIFKDALDKMVDHSCDPETEEEMRSCVLKTPGVLGIDLLQTRMFGPKVYADIEIIVDGDLVLRDAHEIAENVHDRIEEEFPKVKHIMVHVNPDK